MQPNVGDSRSFFMPKYKVDVSDYKSDFPLYTYMVERRRTMKPYTERQLQILHGKIPTDQIKNTELGRLMKKAAEAEDSEGLATAQYLWDLKHPESAERSPPYSVEKAKRILQELTPWVIDWDKMT